MGQFLLNALETSIYKS